MSWLPSLALLCIALQALGGAIGVGYAVWAEIAYIGALRDGHIDDAERHHLAIIAEGLRFGMTALLVGSVALTVIAYALHASVQPALTSAYWTFISLALIVIATSWAISRQRVNYALGSAAIFSGWWLIAGYAFGVVPFLSFASAMALYVIGTGVLYYALRVLRVFGAPAAHNAIV